ncbi:MULTISPECIES: flagellar hook-basal body complex protein FliE [Ectothiorhodospira]|uniref:flagellar hook-basal body complex protein FliE n=1 Tax=Ectothiorhodospira TaxID=1051 RepID=UPI00024A8A66|nr:MULTISPECIES: flagellar hook-basal body complex protein FliE [Ectothiorhodospira]EHQ51973.1 flagellar hook-basal body protein FliE [Ectothiorhodospira sp. PHS-1]MCG5514212.1 flagellar hook-basal body complex protein FliE [Ectothiorhodospira shaposhnikovii]
MSDMQINQVLQQMRVLAASAGLEGPKAAVPPPAQPNFAAALKQSMDKVNSAQQKGNQLATRFEMGDPDVDLAQVMIATQKASISFEATMQVRNRLVSAYQDIMNMQV